jgi:GGDEF domain-containing protein
MKSIKKIFSISDAEQLAPNKQNIKSVLANFYAVIDNGGKFNVELESIARNHACRLLRRMTADEFAPALDNGLENENAVQAAQNILQKLTAQTFEEENGFYIDFCVVLA